MKEVFGAADLKREGETITRKNVMKPTPEQRLLFYVNLAIDWTEEAHKRGYDSVTVERHLLQAIHHLNACAGELLEKSDE